MLDPHRLKVFRAVMATGSIASAASSLGYTPSAISQQLSSLQREVGLALFERRGRGIVPTEIGFQFAESCQQALEGLEALEGAVSDLRMGRDSRLCLSYVSSAGLAWVPPVAAALSIEFPNVRLDLRLSELAGADHIDPDVEIYVDGTASSTEPGYDSTLLVDEPYLVVLAESHPLASRRTVPLAALQGERWVDNDITRGPCRQILLDACASIGFTPTFHLQTHDYGTAVAFVAAGVGVTVLPRLGARHLPTGVVAIPIVDPQPRRRVMLRSRSSLRSHPAAVRAVTLLREAAARDGRPA